MNFLKIIDFLFSHAIHVMCYSSRMLKNRSLGSGIAPRNMVYVLDSSSSNNSPYKFFDIFILFYYYIKKFYNIFNISKKY